MDSTSFQQKDGKRVMRHKPGQYLTFALELPEKEPIKRNYSISSGPEDRSYRISVKREAKPGVPPGIVSNWLHDHAGPGTVLKVAPPAGEFFLNEKEDNPVVLLSGGVGLTPMVSMLEHVVRSLRAMVGGLARTGVALNRILYEFFGPADELLAA